MEIPLDVQEAFPLTSNESFCKDKMIAFEEHVEGRKVLVTRYGYRDHTTPIRIPRDFGGIPSYVSTLALSRM